MIIAKAAAMASRRRIPTTKQEDNQAMGHAIGVLTFSPFSLDESKEPWAGSCVS